MTEKQDTWHVVSITARPEAAEAIEFALNELDTLGTEINNLGKKKTDKIKVNGYFNERVDNQQVSDQLASSLRIHALAGDRVESVEWSVVENKDWLAEWKKHWKPTDVGRFVIAPPWSEVTSSNIVIRIEPNMAFGTGTHETTQLCLEAISKIYKPEQSLLDVGTGTGILAIAAAKLGGTSILACDTDADSVRIASENAVANGVEDKITFLDGPIDDETPVHDFVCANLTLDVISPILPLLIAKTRCVLLLSGILVEQQPTIGQELRYLSIQNFEVKQAGEWIFVLVTFNQLS